MDYFKDLNNYLDKGFKLTNTNCPICKLTIVFNPKDKQFFCTKCKLPVKIESYEQQDDDSEEEQVVVTKEVESFKWHQEGDSKKQSTSSQTSQKLGQKLLQGWCMLEQTCEVCHTPIMRSKQQEYVCVTCNWSKHIKPTDEIGLSKIGEPPSKQQPSQESVKIESSPQKNSAQAPNQETSTTKPIQQKSNFQSTSPNIQIEEEMIQKLLKHYNQRLEKLISINSEAQIDDFLMNQFPRLLDLAQKIKSNTNN